ncbi:hydrogenase maturation protease [Streptomyces pluripotens]|uniref:Hydrogenase maturation protease n=1 Tax=Streptomyces pluripotens TaxID=1355015 RepID=A0A221NSF2_9ACTN|nr:MULTISPECIES: hydrogenase maturation protease [Streptomyces]ARP68642.1 hydrogenase maturation protease [Streptomyces pluripotens]ASN22901.1 hydrogenase maturation protease [Streptomyces pluripotens]KIE26723.1 hydrogenase maturation protease [Streptomyces sp. MUSC 125]MCH0559268.1 hydrogenase maturation protease [Streptomyces sp. MUM 16J]
MTANGRVVVIGVGNPLRGDDGAGPAVVEALRGQVPENVVLAVSDGEPARMLGLWQGAETVVVVEALRIQPARPGRLHTLTAAQAAGHAPATASTHALGLGECLALAEALHRLPPELVVHAVEVSDVELGTGLSAPVRSALPRLISRTAASVRRALGPDAP